MPAGALPGEQGYPHRHLRCLRQQVRGALPGGQPGSRQQLQGALLLPLQHRHRVTGWCMPILSLGCHLWVTLHHLMVAMLAPVGSTTMRTLWLCWQAPAAQPSPSNGTMHAELQDLVSHGLSAYWRPRTDSWSSRLMNAQAQVCLLQWPACIKSDGTPCHLNTAGFCRCCRLGSGGCLRVVRQPEQAGSAPT